MKHLEKSDIDRYHSFFSQLEYAIEEAIKLTNDKITRRSPNRVTPIYKSKQRFLNAESPKKDIYRALYRAKSGSINLDSITFKYIKSILIRSELDREIINDIQESYSVYFEINKNFNSKRSIFRGTSYFTTNNAKEHFNDILRNLGYYLDHLTDEDSEKFHEFIDKAIEIPFSNNDARTAITNAHAITLFMHSSRSTTFSKLKDEHYFTRLSFAARLGAWTSQYVGQRGTFNYFLKILEEAAKSRFQKSVIGLHAIRWHEANWFKNIGLPYKGNHALKAYEALTNGEKIINFNTGYDSTIIINAAQEAVQAGATHKDLTKSSSAENYTIEDLIKKAEETQIPEAYRLSSQLATKTTKVRSLINANELEEAEKELKIAWDLFIESPVRNKISHYRLLLNSGILEQKKTRELKNARLVEAYELAVEIGAFHYAAEAAKWMKW